MKYFCTQYLAISIRINTLAIHNTKIPFSIFPVIEVFLGPVKKLNIYLKPVKKLDIYLKPEV